MTNIDPNMHIRLLRQEFLLQESKYDKVKNKDFASLRDDGEVYFAQYVGFDDSRGNLILKFSLKNSIPRKGEELLALVPDNTNNHPTKCNGLKYKSILSKAQRSTSLRPVWYKQEADNRILIGFSGCSEEFLSELPLNIQIILGPGQPPTEYLRNLIYLLENKELYPRFREVVDLEIDKEYWSPELLTNDKNTALFLSADLQVNRDLVIQGPPGTGKSYLIAKLCDLFLKQNKKVLISSLTNKALTEIIEKEGLENHLANGKIYKSSLSVDEKRKYPFIRSGSDYTIKDGTLLLSSYYNLSQLARENTGSIYDIVIVEEGSQAFLSTIGAARHLGETFLLVGDQKQLAPIRMIKNQDLEHPNLQKAFEGFSTFGNYFPKANKYLLNKSFRLNENAVELTNSFYDNLLVSGIKEDSTVQFPNGYISSNSILYRPLIMPEGVRSPSHAIRFVTQEFLAFYEKNPKSSFAILSVFKASVKSLQSHIIEQIGFKNNVLVDTIDRVQGLTVDFCFFFIPNTGLGFSLEPRRFNVATSRAKYFTGIFAPDNINFNDFDDNVKTYFEKLIGHK
jgi:DNA replication ATP-dependent helicase Dna2